MKNGPSMAVPGVFSPAEEKQIEINDIADLVIDDPEHAEATENLIYALKNAWNQESEDLAWTSFTDRIKFLISRAERALVAVESDEDREGA